MAGNLRKSYANKKNYHLSIPNSVVEWCGWPKGPYGAKGETFTYNVKDKNGKTITQQGYKICKPTTYVKGSNSMECLYYNEIGKTTIKN